jgi:hypothetical protein
MNYKQHHYRSPYYIYTNTLTWNDHLTKSVASRETRNQRFGKI